MLTERWFWYDQTLVQSSVSSFDQIEIVWMRSDTEQQSDRTLGARVRSTPARFQRGRILIGRVRLVLTGRWSGSGY